MFAKQIAKTLSVIALCLGLIGVENAEAAVFNFEGDAATSSQSSHPGALTSLVQADSGLTITITRPSSTFDIVNTNFVNVSFPPSFGTRSLDPFSADTSNTPFFVNLSAPATSVSIDYGDFGADSDTFLLQAFSGPNGTGTLLASATDVYGLLSFPIFHTVSLSAAGISSLEFIGGSPGFPNSVYYDNLVISTAAVPEPASLILFGSALAGLGIIRRRRKGM
jgi:hypothetical protein